MLTYLNCDGVEGISVDRTPQHALKEDDEDSDPKRGDEEVDGFTEQEIDAQDLEGEEREGGRGRREKKLNSALVYTQALESTPSPVQ